MIKKEEKGKDKREKKTNSLKAVHIIVQLF
jgi:hypothetical protein